MVQARFVLLNSIFFKIYYNAAIITCLIVLAIYISNAKFDRTILTCFIVNYKCYSFAKNQNKSKSFHNQYLYPPKHFNAKNSLYCDNFPFRILLGTFTALQWFLDLFYYKGGKFINIFIDVLYSEYYIKSKDFKTYTVFTKLNKNKDHRSSAL